jgi:ParB/RepB/Spo0J family partition protein
VAQQLKRATKKTAQSKPPDGAAPEASPPTTGDGGPKFFELNVENDGDSLSIRLADITPNPFNDRDLGDVSQLSESIEDDGLLQDVTVMHTAAFAKHWPEQAKGITTKYVLAFGERRWRAYYLLAQAGKLQLAEEGKPETAQIPTILRNDVAPKIRRVLFAENFHRKQLSPIEEARKFYVLHVEEEMSFRQIVEHLRLTGPNHVSRRLELLKLPPALQEIVGTETGPGVTLARKILAQLADPAGQLKAWELIRDDELTLNQAVAHIRNTESVPPGNTADDVEEAANATEDSSGTPASVPQGNTSNEAETTKETAEAEPPGVPPGNTGLPSPRNTADASAEAVGVSAKKSAEAPVGGARKVTAAERDTAERNNASADRDEACRHLVTTGVQLTQEQRDALFGRTLLAPIQQGPARTRAHQWLRKASKAVFDIADTDSYYEAVLSSGQPDLVNRVALATALAAGEIRARDGRRQWDKTDAEHVRLLTEATGYVPGTAWERWQLEKFGVPFTADQDPDPEPIPDGSTPV